jgi:hypothetical protein
LYKKNELVTDLQEEITTIRRAFKEFIEYIKFDFEETESDSLASYIWKRVEKYEGILDVNYPRL